MAGVASTAKRQRGELRGDMRDFERRLLSARTPSRTKQPIMANRGTLEEIKPTETTESRDCRMVSFF